MLRRDFVKHVGRVTAASLAGRMPGVGDLLAAGEAAARAATEKLYGVRVGKLRGYVDAFGRLAIAPRFATGYGFAGGFMVFEEGGRHGVVDVAARELIPPVFEDSDLHGFGDGFWAVKLAGAWGFVDVAGRWLVEPQFAAVKRFSQGLAAVQLGELWGYIDARGELVIAPRFTSAGRFAEGLAPCAEDGAWGFIDRQGAWAIEPTYDFTAEFADGRGMVGRGRSYGFVDSAGKQVIARRFRWATAFHEGLAKVELPRKLGPDERPPDAFYKTRYLYIATDGEVVLELPAGDYPYIFTYGRAAIGRPVAGGKARRWGFIDRSGATVVPFQYDEVCVFDEHGFAHVRTSEGWHVIDADGRYLVRVVVDDDGERLLDGLGHQLWPPP